MRQLSHGPDLEARGSGSFAPELDSDLAVPGSFLSLLARDRSKFVPQAEAFDFGHSSPTDDTTFGKQELSSRPFGSSRPRNINDMLLSSSSDHVHTKEYNGTQLRFGDISSINSTSASTAHSRTYN